MTDPNIIRDAVAKGLCKGPSCTWDALTKLELGECSRGHALETIRSEAELVAAELLASLIDKEQARWQEAINTLCCKLAPDANIDGAGCDSGDPLDLSLAEISQAVNHHANIISNAIQIIKDDCPEGGTPNDLVWACEEVAACDKLFRVNDDLMQIAEGTDGLVDVINILWHRLQEAEGTLSP